ncbi:hypothetical protein RND71_024912 [Anisodus tanguticus]|uniref:Uncharacterized protein n=1 Tax=Anisodus tanguticus TaxID=243964 RepID=A0AAE1RRY2_9SOLA|nr:hypothetical protein RND71_024912 [Anisodus tanguticus]
MLMEEDDLENRPCMFQDYIALQAAEKSFYDALNPPVHRDFVNSNTHWQDDYCDDVNQFVESRFISDLGGDQCPLFYSGLNNYHQAAVGAPNTGGKSRSEGEKKKHNREENGDTSKGRNLKQFASNGTEETEEYYDKALLCPGMNHSFYENRSKSSTLSDNAAWDKQKSCPIKQSKGGRPRGSKKGAKTNEVVDLTSLLTRCAEAAVSYNSKTFMEVLNKVRQHSSPFGDATARLAYCFANALEARFAGDDATLATSRRISAADFLKAYQVYITSCPFKRMSNVFANKSIAKLTSESPRIHIIDFGILYGFQWPCIVHGMSLGPGGPPKLKITGIDFPQRGFRPAEMVEETGRRLENFSKRFGVPFEYKAIAKKWDDIKLEDLEIDRDEMLVFDMFEATMTREDEDRMKFEQEVFGRDTMNVIACEGTERVERPESYSQWSVRNQIAGFRQLLLDRDIVNEVKAKVRMFYHTDFLVDEDSNWMLQGWKGRIMYALSVWEPIHK